MEVVGRWLLELPNPELPNPELPKPLFVFCPPPEEPKGELFWIAFGPPPKPPKPEDGLVPCAELELDNPVAFDPPICAKAPAAVCAASFVGS